MALDRSKDYYCEKCCKSMRGDNFYQSNNTEKYPNDGALNMCKRCATLHVNNWEPETFLWILQELDVPWIPDKWNELLARYRNKKLTGQSIMGRYLSVMQLVQYKEYRWKDTEFLQKLKDERTEAAMKRQGFSAAEIAMQIQKGTFEMPEEIKQPEYNDYQDIIPLPADEPAPQKPASASAEDLGLTEEDCRYLLLKWGGSYKPEEWVRLEQLYTEMIESYDIQTAGHKDTLILACKTSLKSNQLLDIGD